MPSRWVELQLTPSLPGHRQNHSPRYRDSGHTNTGSGFKLPESHRSAPTCKLWMGRWQNGGSSPVSPSLVTTGQSLSELLPSTCPERYCIGTTESATRPHNASSEPDHPSETMSGWCQLSRSASMTSSREAAARIGDSFVLPHN